LLLLALFFGMKKKKTYIPSTHQLEQNVYFLRQKIKLLHELNNNNDTYTRITFALSTNCARKKNIIIIIIIILAAMKNGNQILKALK
jgi:hypothetical protein